MADVTLQGGGCGRSPRRGIRKQRPACDQGLGGLQEPAQQVSAPHAICSVQSSWVSPLRLHPATFESHSGMYEDGRKAMFWYMGQKGSLWNQGFPASCAELRTLSAS